ncbi:alpha-2,8-polysialyltransferase family protein [Streptomyces sp. NPDC054887]
MPTTQIFFASTLYGAATLAAAIDSDCFGPAGRRLLLVSNNATTPETTPSVDEMPGFERLRTRFDGVLSWNEAVAPFHPGAWSPRVEDIPLWERHLRLLWGLGDDTVELFVESIQVDPALALTQMFTDAPVEVYADGLMSYGPTRNKLDPLVGTRVRRLLHLDLVPGLTPLLLGEFDVPPEVVPTEAFMKVLSELADAEDGLDVPAGAALLLGQYLSALNILTAEEEEDLHVRMLRGAVGRGHRQVVFKPHPTAPARWSRVLEREARELGVELTVLESPVLAEVLYQRFRPALVVGCFSTALMTASTFYGVPVVRTGTDVLLERLSPYQNSNRVPVTIVDALLPALAGDDGRAEPVSLPYLTGLLRAVGFAMQPRIRADLRPAAERFLTQHLAGGTWRYFKRRRLTTLALPGAVPRQFAFVPRNAALRRVVRRARSFKRAALKKAALG